MKKKFSMKRRLAAFALGGCALFGAANAENWIPVGSGDLTIFIPQFNFQANKTSTSDYTLSWNAQSGATSYKVERLFAGVTPATADEIVTEWRTVADTTATSLTQSHNLSTQDLDGHQLYRLSSCIQTVCTELDELYYFTDKNDLSTTVPQNFTLTHIPPATSASAKVAGKTFTTSADSEDNPYAYGKGYSFITGHENPNSTASASKIAKYEAEHGVQTVSKSSQVSSAVTYITRNEVLLTWDPVEHATHYVVSRVPDRGASPTFERLYGEGHSLFASDTSFVLKLQAGVYDFVVYA